MNATRMGMWETNSSSSHCLVLRGEDLVSLDLMDVALPSHEGTLLLHPQIFGAEEGFFCYHKRKLTSSWDKINYLATYILADLCYPWIEAGKQQAAKDLLAEAVAEVTGLQILWPETYEAETDNLNDYWESRAFESKETLIQTIFNPGYQILLNSWGGGREDDTE